MLNLKQVKEAIKNKEVFSTKNIEAYYMNGVYSIDSYLTLIYTDKEGLDNRFYSVTTSKLQNMIREAFNLEKTKV